MGKSQLQGSKVSGIARERCESQLEKEDTTQSQDEASIIYILLLNRSTDHGERNPRCNWSTTKNRNQYAETRGNACNRDESVKHLIEKRGNIIIIE